jgi:hypothetical protein
MSTVRKLDIAEATESLAEYAQKADEGPLVVTKGGQPIALVVRVENADLETVALSNHPEFLNIIERSRARQKQEGGIPSEDVRGLFESE